MDIDEMDNLELAYLSLDSPENVINDGDSSLRHRSSASASSGLEDSSSGEAKHARKSSAFHNTLKPWSQFLNSAFDDDDDYNDFYEFSDSDSSLSGSSDDEEHEHSHHGHSHHGHSHLTAWELSKFNSIESLDYQIIDTEVYRRKMSRSSQFGRNKTIYKWICQFVIGALTGIVAFMVSESVDRLEELKFGMAQFLIDKNLWIVAFICFSLVCASLICFSSFLVVFIQPAAAGSGIPEVKAYLNGCRVPKAFNIKTLILKIVGVICSVSSGLAVGPEGPMIHTGAMIGAGISQGKSKTLHFNLYRVFQNDRDKRDFISAGAAAGVSAAFNAPIGGILFALEEISSFWAVDLTWQSFFGCMIAVYSSNLFTAWLRKDTLGYFRSGSFILFEVSEHRGYWYPEVIVFVILGAIGGLTGAIFNRTNSKIATFRRDYLRKKRFMRVLEAVLICLITTTLCFWLPLLWPCKQVEERFNEHDRESVRLQCPEGEYNPAATLFFTGQEKSIRHLFSRRTTDEFDYFALIAYWLAYYVLAMVTAGMSVASGLVVPMLIIGGSYGRVIGHLVHHLFPSLNVDAGTYSLVGASSFLGGVSRMTVSMSVIMLEITNDIEFLLPIMLVFMVSKWVGDLFSHPLYDLLLEVKCLPCLEWSPPSDFKRKHIEEVMTKDPICLREVENVGYLVDLLSSTPHNGFPVIDAGLEGKNKIFLGIVLRRHILSVLRRRLFQPSPHEISIRDPTFNELRVTPKPISKVSKKITLVERGMYINITPLVNRTSFPCYLSNNVEIIYVLFRTLGIRHMTVVDRRNEVVGIITRKDLHEHLVEYKEAHGGRFQRTPTAEEFDMYRGGGKIPMIKPAKGGKKGKKGAILIEVDDEDGIPMEEIVDSSSSDCDDDPIQTIEAVDGDDDDIERDEHGDGGEGNDNDDESNPDAYVPPSTSTVLAADSHPEEKEKEYGESVKPVPAESAAGMEDDGEKQDGEGKKEEDSLLLDLTSS